MINGSDTSRLTVQQETNRQIRQYVHQRLLASIELEGVDGLADRASARQRVQRLLREELASRRDKLSKDDHIQIENEILDEVEGLGPLAPLMADPEISDILVNGPDDVWIDRYGQLSKTAIRFDDSAHLRRFLDRLVAAQGRHLDEASPLVDARLSDGSRLHAVLPPLSSRGPIVSIRRFRVNPFSLNELITEGVLNQEMADLLKLAVAGRLNIVVAGGAASGKTTLLNVLSKFIPDNERVVTIEETAELKLAHPHVISLEGRPANVEGRGEITLRSLVRNALRMRADRIIIGEVRGPEVFDMLQAMNVGHDGSLTTVHANSPDDVLRRLESLVLMAALDLPRPAIQAMIGAAIDLIVHVTRYRDGSRRVVSIREVIQEGAELSTKELFRFQLNPVANDERIVGTHQATGEQASCMQRLAQLGFEVTAEQLGLNIDRLFGADVASSNDDEPGETP